MKRKIRIETVSTWSMVLTLVLSLVCILFFAIGAQQFSASQKANQAYMLCENASRQMQSASDYLTEQVRLATLTSEKKYIDNYFTEVNVTRRRENALESLRTAFAGTESFSSLQSALQGSVKLTQTEYYAMRLILEASAFQYDAWPTELQSIELTASDQLLSSYEKVRKAQNLVSNRAYQQARSEISSDVTHCMNSMIHDTKSGQGHSSTVFRDIYLKLEICIGLFVVLSLAVCFLIRRLVVSPLRSYNTSIQLGEIFPVVGAAELQHLAETYNRVYLENEETQMLIRHQAEHDALTDILNRGSFDKMLNIYEGGDRPFALILADVDTFKSVNDTYGHAMGDKILKKVASLLTLGFRSIDHICRIGGDEFAVIMVEMTSDLQYTILEKINEINRQLLNPEDGLPPVSLSVGVAFTDREGASDSLFKDADRALYRTKENGRNGCSFYGLNDAPKPPKEQDND